MMPNDKSYKNNYEFDWNLTPKQQKIIQGKVDYIKHLIPKNVKTIIDIGCGEGFITNQLIDDYEVTAVDINSINVDKLKCKTIHSFAHELNLPKNSYDLVLSSEMLEHLPDEKILLKTVVKFKELAKKYILITVPNDEKLRNTRLFFETRYLSMGDRLIITRILN